MVIDKMIRKLVVAIAILVSTLCAGLFIQNNVRGQSTPEILLSGFKAGEVNEIQITQKGKSFKIIKSDTSWELKEGSLPILARPSSIDEMLAWLEKVKSICTVSEDGLGADKLGFSATSTTIRLHDAMKKEIESITLGKKSDTGNEVYVQLGSAPAIYAIDGTFEAIANRGEVDWADKRLWPFDREDVVQSFSVEKSNEKEVFTKASDNVAWSGVGSVIALKATAMEISPLLRQILTLDGDKVELLNSEQKSLRFKALEKVYAVMINAGRTYRVDFYQAAGKKDDDYVLDVQPSKLSADGRFVVITIPAWRVGDLAIRLSEPSVPITN